MTQRTPDEFKAAYEHHKNAGDTQKAARVAQLYRQSLAQQQPQQQPQQQQPAGSQAQPQAKDGPFEGFRDTFVRGIDQPLENMAVTADLMGNQGLSQSLKDAVTEVPGQSASGQFMNADQDGTFAWRYAPKAIVERVASSLHHNAAHTDGWVE